MDLYLDPSQNENMKNRLKIKLDEQEEKIKNAKNKIDEIDVEIKQIERIINSDQECRIDYSNLYDNKIITNQLSRVILNKVTLGNENIKIEILEWENP